MRAIETLLHDVPLFEGLKPDELELLAGCASNVRFQDGDVLFREGDAADTFYLVRHGTVALEMFVPARGSMTIETVQEGEVVGWANWSGYVYPRQVQFREAVNHSFAIVLSPAAWEERFVALRDAVDLARYRREEAAQRERKERWETPTVVTPDTPRTIDLGCGHRVVVSLGNTYVQGSPGAKIIFVREGLPPVVVGPLRDRTGEISDMHQPDMCHNWIRLRRPYGAADTDPVSVPEECGCHSSTLGLSFMER